MGLFNKLFNKSERPENNYTEPANEPQNEDEEDTVIAESMSVLCDAQAFVDRQDDCIYFYILSGALSRDENIEVPQMRTCWVCNRRKAPKKLEFTGSKAPMMPEEFVAHDVNGIDLDPDSLSIVWMEDGASAVLHCDGEPICYIPMWSGIQGFHGFSKYAKGMGPYAWEMDNALPQILTNLRRSQAFYDNFTGSHDKEWRWLYSVLPRVKGFVGEHENDFNIANKTDIIISDTPFPPKVVISGHRSGVVYGITVGVSLLAMPISCVSKDVEPEDINRMELGFAADESCRELCRPMYANLSMFAALPWQLFTHLAHGHTVPMRNIDGFSAALFLNPKFVPEVESPEYGEFPDGSPINMMWVVPLTEEEYRFTVHNGSNELLKKCGDISRVHIFDGKPKFIR